jgi:hypothetical protein
MALIQRTPFVAAPAPFVPAYLRARRLLGKRFPYAIVYRVSRDEIVVLAFPHLKQRPGYWRQRK